MKHYRTHIRLILKESIKNNNIKLFNKYIEHYDINLKNYIYLHGSNHIQWEIENFILLVNSDTKNILPKEFAISTIKTLTQNYPTEKMGNFIFTNNSLVFMKHLFLLNDENTIKNFMDKFLIDDLYKNLTKYYYKFYQIKFIKDLMHIASNSNVKNKITKLILDKYIIPIINKKEFFSVSVSILEITLEKYHISNLFTHIYNNIKYKIPDVNLLNMLNICIKKITLLNTMSNTHKKIIKYILNDINVPSKKLLTQLHQHLQIYNFVYCKHLYSNIMKILIENDKNCDKNTYLNFIKKYSWFLPKENKKIINYLNKKRLN